MPASNCSSPDYLPAHLQATCQPRLCRGPQPETLCPRPHPSCRDPLQAASVLETINLGEPRLGSLSLVAVLLPTGGRPDPLENREGGPFTVAYSLEATRDLKV